ncbi:MAG: hypothetical protein CR974_01325 [Gammaproteobacteria bacterium]|nr:MAG: hypothetical protein CR974_01325 [Gammaproteobacteria bacterium]
MKKYKKILQLTVMAGILGGVTGCSSTYVAQQVRNHGERHNRLMDNIASWIDPYSAHLVQNGCDPRTQNCYPAPPQQ